MYTPYTILTMIHLAEIRQYELQREAEAYRIEKLSRVHGPSLIEKTAWSVGNWLIQVGQRMQSMANCSNECVMGESGTI